MKQQQNYINYSNIDCVMPYMFTNDIWILILDELLKNEKNPVKYIYGSVYCAWQSGRHAKVFEQNLSIIETYLQKICSYGLIPNFTFSTMNITKEKLKDNFSNDLLDISYKHNSYYIVASKEMYNHIKTRYNDAKMVCSVILPSNLYQTGNFNETEFYNKMLEKYEIVVVRPEYILENINSLDKLISDISRIEVLVNQNCFYNCPNQKKHYTIQEENDFIFSQDIKSKTSQLIIDEKINEFCPHCTLPPEQFRSVRLTKMQMEELIQLGVKNFKFQGRDGHYQSIFNDLYEYLFNQYYSKTDLKNKIDSVVSDLVFQNRQLQYLYLLNQTTN